MVHISARKGGGKAGPCKGKGSRKGKAEAVVVAEDPEGGEGWLKDAMDKLTGHVKSAEEWMEGISKRASVIEMRMMNNRCLVHEAMRTIQQLLTSFHPMGDPGWIMRSIQDSMASAEFS